ncbi:hypothetical protein LENED_012268 [Lentinula edodes]|uniref:Uncharacterized protein n=1 Tax=Lentinula edodes TaxID=5353 RepID=A0A1Q3ES74_LENED|nr:hypothetical protein LENED_012268 [Lentinula edodes]
MHVMSLNHVPKRASKLQGVALLPAVSREHPWTFTNLLGNLKWRFGVNFRMISISSYIPPRPVFCPPLYDV